MTVELRHRDDIPSTIGACQFCPHNNVMVGSARHCGYLCEVEAKAHVPKLKDNYDHYYFFDPLIYITWRLKQ